MSAGNGPNDDPHTLSTSINRGRFQSRMECGSMLNLKSLTKRFCIGDYLEGN